MVDIADVIAGALTIAAFLFLTVVQLLFYVAVIVVAAWAIHTWIL